MKRYNTKRCRIFLVFMVVFMMFMTACDTAAPTSVSDTDRPAVSQDEADHENSGYLFTFDGTEIAVDAPITPLFEKLPAYRNKFVSQSCVFESQETIYYFNSFQLTTYVDEEGTERIFSIYLEDDSVATAEGISVGAAEDEVTGAYGEPSDQTGQSLAYTKDHMTLSFVIKEEAVASISYQLRLDN